MAIKGSVLRMEEMRKKVSDGEIESVNRKKSEIIQQKIDKGRITSSSWFLRGNTYYVISCQPTPGGILAKKLNERVNAINPTKRILVTEDGGSPTISSLKKSDPFRLPTCRFSDPRCIVENGRDCAKQGVIYEISCTQCNQDSQEIPTSRDPGSWNNYNYIGMTRCSAHWRMKLHLQGQRQKSKSNPLHRHDVDVHNGVEQIYQTRILSTEKNLLPLCILEGLHIEKQNKLLSMNDKNEFGRGGVIRLTANRIT